MCHSVAPRSKTFRSRHGFVAVYWRVMTSVLAKCCAESVCEGEILCQSAAEPRKSRLVRVPWPISDWKGMHGLQVAVPLTAKSPHPGSSDSCGFDSVRIMLGSRLAWYDLQ